MHWPSSLTPQKRVLYPFQVIDKFAIADDYEDAFILVLKPKVNLNLQSGDLWTIYPPIASLESFYSIITK